MSLLRRLSLLLALAALFTFGCSDTPDVTDTHYSDRCPDGECSFCTSDTECDGNTHCADDEGHRVCVTNLCVPQAAHCEGDQVVRCDDRGSAYRDPISCDGGTCMDGACGCETGADCGEGETCSGGTCGCPSGQYCGDDAICCAEGESCDSAEFCDDDGCRFVSFCRPACEGAVCGLQGELCCEGETPVCGPTGECAPSCEGEGELCGEDFDQCCPGGDVCVFGDCRTPGESCTRFSDCDFGEYCDEALGRCMPDDFPGDIECRVEGDFYDMEVTEKWSWTDEDIISIPVVGDVTGDGEPNVVINASRIDGSEWNFELGEIVILDSAGNQIHRVPHNPGNDSWGSQGRSNIALADLTGNGVLDIIYPTRTTDDLFDGPSYIVAIDGQGNKLWRARDAGSNPVEGRLVNGAITVANFDGDPNRAQVVVGGMLINHDGRVLWNEGDGPTVGTNDGYTGGVAVVADINGDGRQNIITGRQAWDVQWQDGATPSATVTELWAHSGPDGYAAVADMNGNGLPEVVLVADGTVRILDGATGELFCGVDPTGQDCQSNPALRTQPIAIPGGSENNRGGPPTVADFDGDGRPEIGVAGGSYYTVFDLNRMSFGDDPSPEDIDESLLSQYGQATPAPGEIFVRWYSATQDHSSNATGSSVFDFQGDGRASVVYADECFLRVYSGADGAVELEVMNSTGTILEYPLVVDVDDNGRSEILVVANDVDWGCSDLVDNFQPRRGLYVYEDPNDRWVRTRSIWNQHAYSIDNILDDGSIPATPAPGWQTHNTFRANLQGEVPLNAADVAIVSVQTNALSCPPDLQFQISLRNDGVASIPAGMPVTIYNVDTDAVVTTLTVDQPIGPGGVVTLQYSHGVSPQDYNTPLNFAVVANDDGTGSSPVYDCDPSKASVLLDTLECRIEG